jgi:hypothetical protein
MSNVHEEVNDESDQSCGGNISVMLFAPIG